MSFWNRIFGDSDPVKKVVKKDENGNIVSSTETSTDTPEKPSKGLLFPNQLGEKARVTIPQDPSILESILKPENKPQLEIQNLLSTVPEKPLNAGVYTPIHNEQEITGYTEGQMPIFAPAGSIFPMGLWDERRRSLLNAYQQRETQIASASQPNYLEGFQTAAQFQPSLNEKWAIKMNDYIRRGVPLDSPQVQRDQDAFKSLAVQGQYTIAKAQEIYNRNADEWQRKPARAMLSGKDIHGNELDITDVAKVSNLLYKIDEYEVAIQDRAKALMGARDMTPVTEAVAKTMNISPEWKQMIESGNGAGVIKYLTFQKYVDEGKFNPVIERMAREYGDMYDAQAERETTVEERKAMAKRDIKAYVGTELGVGTTGYSAPSSTTFNYNEAKKKPTVMEDYRNFQLGNDQTIKKELGDISSMVAYDLTTKGISTDTPQGQKEAITAINEGMNKLSETLTVDGQRWLSPSTSTVSSINSPVEMDIFSGALPNLRSDKTYISFEEIIDSQESESVKNEMRAELKKAGIHIGTKIPVTLTDMKAAFLNKNTRKALRYKDMIPGSGVGEKKTQSKWLKNQEYNPSSGDYGINFEDYNPSVALHYSFTFDKNMINQLTKGSDSFIDRFKQLTGGVFGKNVYNGVKYSDLRSNPDMVTLNSLFEADATPQYPTSTNYRKATQQ